MHRKLKEKSTSALFPAAFYYKVRDIYLFTGGQRSLCTLEPMCGVQRTTYAGQFPLSAMWGSRTYEGQSSLFPPCGTPELMRVSSLLLLCGVPELMRVSSLFPLCGVPELICRSVPSRTARSRGSLE